MLFILFGKSGAGKSYIGELMSAKFGFHHFDADELLTDQMKAYVRAERIFTQKMRDEYTQKLMAHISELRKCHTHLVLSQALYKRVNRATLAEKIPVRVHFIYVQADDALCYKRIAARSNWVSVDYAKKMVVNFEPPESSASCHVIMNNQNSSVHLIPQIKRLIEKAYLAHFRFALFESAGYSGAQDRILPCQKNKMITHPLAKL